MPTNTFANNFEICSKGSSSGMATAAAPDPCFTPPVTPAGTEVVIPYPNMAKAGDLDKGSSKVLICNKMACMEKSSHLKTSMGDEAAVPSTMKGGVISHKTQGKCYFTSWSSDVKIEGKGACRHFDPTSHNHASQAGNAPGGVNTDSVITPGDCENLHDDIKNNSECKGTTEKSTTNKKLTNSSGGTEKKFMTIPSDPNCKAFEELLKFRAGTKEAKEQNVDGLKKTAEELGVKNVKFCKETYFENYADALAEVCSQNPCIKAIRCQLAPYKQTTSASKNKAEVKCCKGQSGHHVIPGDIAQSIDCLNYSQSSGASGDQKSRYREAPVVCVEGENHSHGTHGRIHASLARAVQDKGHKINCKDVFSLGAQSVAENLDCGKECIERQLKESTQSQCECGQNGNPKTVTINDGTGGSGGEAPTKAVDLVTKK